MPYSTSFEPKGAVTCFKGIVTYDEIYASNLALWNSPHWRDMEYQIADLLDVTQLEVGTTEPIEVAFLDNASSRTNNHMRVAIVATDPKIIAHCHHYIALLDAPGWKAEIFSEFEVALIWALAGKKRNRVTIPASEVILATQRFKTV